MDDDCIQLAITSPPYYRTRDYQVEGQIGWESSGTRVHQQTSRHI